MPEREFTPAFMATGLICPPDSKHIEYGVMGESRLFADCRSAPNSVPMWKVRLDNAQGTNTYKTLGTIKELTLAQARKQAQLLKAENAIAKQAWKQKPPQAEMTLDTFMEIHALPHLRMVKRSFVRDEQLYRRIAPKFGSLHLKSITRYQAEQFKSDLMKEKMSPASVDHHLKLLRHLLNLAVQWDMLEKNPLKGFQLLNVDNQVENYLKGDDLQRFLEVLRTDANRSVCLILMYLLSTGARLNEAVQARWDQIDVEGGVWRIPAANSKSKRTRSVPLNDSALWVLEQAKLRGDFEYPFANPETGKPMVSLRAVFYRLCKKAQVKLRIHDLRHSFASLLVSGGRSLYEVQQILGHSDPKVTMRYAHLSTKALQEAASSASVIVPKTKQQEVAPAEAVPEPKPTANVVQFPKAA